MQGTERNHDRGLRSIAAIERRKEQRTLKTWKLRKIVKQEKKGIPRPQPEAQDPEGPTLAKFQIGGKLNIATLNVRGMKQVGKREEI